MGFSESVAVEFANAPVVEVAGKVSGPSLHAAIRRALKVDEDWPLVAYRNHAQLESFVFRFIEGLNTRLGDRADLLILRNEVDTDSIVGIHPRQEKNNGWYRHLSLLLNSTYLVEEN